MSPLSRLPSADFGMGMVGQCVLCSEQKARLFAAEGEW